MIRDSLADEAYFTQLMKKWDDYVQEDKAEVDDKIARQGPEVSMMCDGIVSDQLRMAFAAYSRGDPIPVVRARVTQAFEDLSYLHRILKHYPNAVRGGESDKIKFYYLSLVIAFGIEGAARQNVLNHFAHYGTGDDPVLDAMLDHIKGQPICQTRDPKDQRYPKTTHLLWDTIELGRYGGEVPLRKYLEGWYKFNDGNTEGGTAVGIGAHKKMIRYIGYWCWEAAAFVLMLGLDDSGFRSHEHYPVDLVDALRAEA